jgi:oxygen-independent coproporphyrinogen-3 oxidase
LNASGIAQYEISNFARKGFESRHNLKYWTRQPYLGFGVDAHSMLFSRSPESEAVRFVTPDGLEKYVAGAPLQQTVVTKATALEEVFFLGLRLNRGVNLFEVVGTFEKPAVDNFRPAISELTGLGLLEIEGDFVRLTRRGRLLSNEVFQAFLANAPDPARG